MWPRGSEDETSEHPYSWQPLQRAEGRALSWGNFEKICLAVMGEQIGRGQNGFRETWEEAGVMIQMREAGTLLWPVHGDLDSGQKRRGPSSV